MEIKTFRDGNRLIVAIDDLEEIGKTEDILINFFKALLPGVDTEKAADGNAVPLKITKEKICYIGIEPYVDKTPKEVLFTQDSKKNNEAFVFLCKELEKGSFGPELTEDIRKNFEVFLKERYKNCKPEEYKEKLSLKQLKTFFKSQWFAFSDEIITILEENNITYQNIDEFTEEKMNFLRGSLVAVLNQIIS